MPTTRRDFLKTTTAAGAAILAGMRPRIPPQRIPLRDVVVLLPGIMGSVLRKDNRDIWALSNGTIVNTIRSLGSNLSSLTLSGDSPDADDLGDGVAATRLFPDTHLIPGLWKIDGYSRISNYITTTFDAQPERNYFEFPYDWRRDNRAAARRLARSSRGWLEAWRRSSGNRNAKLILIAHSMGGLVSRHFLEVLEGWKNTRMLITFGTPYRGAPGALNTIANGVSKSVGPFTLFDISAMVRSFTSVYQLLPIYPCYDAGNGSLVRVGETTGIPNVDAKRAAAALAFHNQIRNAVVNNAKDSKYRAGRYALHPIVGNYQPTLQSASLVQGAVRMSEALGGDTTLRGDGTVPEASARPIETQQLEDAHRTVYTSEVHGSLQNLQPLLDHIGGLLREGTRNEELFRGVGLNVAFKLDDVYTTTERVKIRAQCEDPGEPLTATVTNVANNAEVVRVQLQSQGVSASEAELNPLPEGTYRVRVGGGPRVGSATDVCIVVGN